MDVGLSFFEVLSILGNIYWEDASESVWVTSISLLCSSSRIKVAEKDGTPTNQITHASPICILLPN